MAYSKWSMGNPPGTANDLKSSPTFDRCMRGCEPHAINATSYDHAERYVNFFAFRSTRVCLLPSVVAASISCCRGSDR